MLIYFVVGFTIITFILESWIRGSIKKWFEENYKDKINELEDRITELEDSLQKGDIDDFDTLE